MHIKNPLSAYLYLLILSVGVGVAHAEPSPETADLALVRQQVYSIVQLADRAERSAATDARFQFDYARLKADLESIDSGLRDYLSPSRAQPADVAPLSGDYTRERRSEVTP